MAATLPVDMELKKAFKELQQKMIETSQKLKMADLQIENLNRNIQHSKLTNTEISSMPENTRMYLGIGRMFLLTDKDNIKDGLVKKVKTSEDKIKNLQNNKVYLERSLKESENNLREMVLQKKKGQ
ncbi:prefoldin subunit 1 [Centruroides vittatus]|uniref:prefoldin subunit 1-like n=1 Tax=Centruroides sculpturatus TaxID=218467 RepID=UPI000C6DB9E0|nr:prefoldin subunit 1-like [Centruroides sculpturatus]